ncbi:MAG: glycine cleavage system aminomethyltransferase GcvT [Gomphosphaeria aponina SAG 52.96 = DSM 107014]|uniref:Aminomethyltransferase n=1 Tax=Gomphosphaeria aponina SAG 52.96 = DSM 107014 TaxID=1521640 RepID=A0A941GUU8_9CHRO|nr:glycine cleavage system aminomethyltransferase GcvT [Gomphosphaeria aponina SAG 52.96 = DSM 107014]
MIKQKRTPLFELAVEQKARLTEFAGWEMPIQYIGLKNEHEAVRKRAGIFDVSHMAKFAFSGKGLVKELQKLVPSDLERLKPGEAQYTVLLNAQGGIIDDIIYYHQGEEQGFMIANAATTEKDKSWLLENLQNSGVELEDFSQKKVLIAIQGPEAVEKLQAFVTEELKLIKAFGHFQGEVLGETAFLGRTGYTGEDGFEVMLDAQVGKKLWRSLVNVGVTPCGLGARDTLRLEAAMCLYGQDMDDSITPLEAGLGWLVHLESKGDFMGRKVLEEQKVNGVKRKLVGLEMEGRYIARHGYPVLVQGETVGEVTSGSLTPTVEKAIALAYLPLSLSKIGQKVAVEIRGKTYPGKVVNKPFYRSSSRVK